MKSIRNLTIGLYALLAQGMLFADEASDNLPKDQGFTQTLVMIAIALVFFYFILWRPEQKRRKAMDDIRTNLKKGDRVTAMGIIGTVSAIKEQTVILKMVDGAKIEVLKGAITDVSAATPEEEAKAD